MNSYEWGCTNSYELATFSDMYENCFKIVLHLKNFPAFCDFSLLYGWRRYYTSSERL